MRRGRTLIFVILFLVIFAAVVFVVFSFMTRKAPQPTEVPQAVQVEVYIAKQNIPQGATITEDVLGTMKIPPENVMAVMYEVNEKGALVNKVAKQTIDQGTPITEAMVLDASSAVPITGPKWATSIPPGMTAISIPASRLSLAARSITSGAHVNVNGCFQFVDIDPTFQTMLPNDTAPLSSTGFLPDTLTALTLGVGSAGGPQGRVELDPSLQQPYYLIPNANDVMQRPRLVCQTLLQDVIVMKVGNFNPAEAQANPVAAAPDPAAQPQQQQQQPQPQLLEDIVTLIVSPQDSITLTYLMYVEAKISMTLRNPNDQARLATEPVSLPFLLGQYNIPVPVKMPYSLEVPFNSLDPSLIVTAPPDLPK
jgi:pilus assembly protein CpaB